MKLFHRVSHRRTGLQSAVVNEPLRGAAYSNTLLTYRGGMKYSTLIEDMITEGATPEMILVAVRAVERQETDALERRRAADRARQERHRTNPSRDKTLRNVSHGLSRSHAGAEDRTSNPVIEPQGKKQNAQPRDEDAFRGGLSPDVPFDLITEFIKVRRKKRGALTGFAAKLFREDAAKCGMSVSEAATECVRSSWITVKPEYFTSRQRAGPAPPAPSQADVFAIIARNPNNAIEPGPSEDRGSFRQAIPHLSAVRTG